MASVTPLDGRDLHSAPLESRKGTPVELLHRTNDGIALNKHFNGDGMIVFRHACALGCEGIISKRLDFEHYRSGRVEPGGARGETRGGRGLVCEARYAAMTQLVRRGD